MLPRVPFDSHAAGILSSFLWRSNLCHGRIRSCSCASRPLRYTAKTRLLLCRLACCPASAGLLESLPITSMDERSMSQLSPDVGSGSSSSPNDVHQWTQMHGMTVSHHTSPIHEYTGFSFTNPPLSLNTAWDASSSQAMQSLVKPIVTWPSVLVDQTTNNCNVRPPSHLLTYGSVRADMQPSPPKGAMPTMQPFQQAWHTPLRPNTGLASSPPISPPTKARSHSRVSGNGPRRTLTDADRRAMCKYSVDHPGIKQADIGRKFSTP